MKKILLCLNILFTMFAIYACNEDEKPSAYEQDVYEFQIINYGTSSIDDSYCGYVIIAQLDSSNRELTRYKTYNFPHGILRDGSYTYTGKLVVYPEILKCRDGRIDPFPGESVPLQDMNRVDIIDWRLK